VWLGPEKHRIVGACLEALRLSGGVTQVELAKRLKKPQSFVSAYESGQRRVDLIEFAIIVAALGGDPRSLSAQVFDALEQSSVAKARRRKS
jgi:transcriptional regulator with XRE-family HTH domain